MNGILEKLDVETATRNAGEEVDQLVNTLHSLLGEMKELMSRTASVAEKLINVYGSDETRSHIIRLCEAEMLEIDKNRVRIRYSATQWSKRAIEIGLIKGTNETEILIELGFKELLAA